MVRFKFYTIQVIYDLDFLLYGSYVEHVYKIQRTDVCSMSVDDIVHVEHVYKIQRTAWTYVRWLGLLKSTHVEHYPAISYILPVSRQSCTARTKSLQSYYNAVQSYCTYQVGTVVPEVSTVVLHVTVRYSNNVGGLPTHVELHPYCFRIAVEHNIQSTCRL
jgi:hypothetical protein